MWRLISGMRQFLIFALSLLSLTKVVAVPPDLLLNDSRRLSQASKAVVLTDFTKAEPATALITGKRQKGKWKMIPFTTAEMKGTALSIYSATSPPVVKLPLAEKGWHAVYVGLATTSGGFNIGTEIYFHFFQ